ncbi:hypothetical protein PV379_00845 [Streptomyces caniscabiei]|uniref:hypothetical protein n=1 Tax=Streptomyces caniscabiei TaxID=2746961 RepID=UPI0029B84F0F|nr:hypothetical protein [Streptomyces caniscabiei]MDX2775902.1 hypothetical protein [Streptomyces caniscabiei]
MKTPETYRAKIVRVGFEPSEQLDAAVDRFTQDRLRGDKLLRSTAHRAVDFDMAEARTEYEQSAQLAERGLRGLGRHALQLAPGVGVQELPHTMRLFLNVASAEMLDEAVGMLRHVDGERVEPKFRGVFIDLARSALGSRTREELNRAALQLRSDLIDPDLNRGLVIQRPRLVVREVHIPRPEPPRRDIMAL